MKKVVFSLLVLFTLLVFPKVNSKAQEIEWDRASIVLEGFCSESGMLHFEVLNHGSDMTGPVQWRMYLDDVLEQNGYVTILADETFYFDWNPADLEGTEIRFEIDQRPNHPGNSQPKKTLMISGCSNILYTPTPTSSPTNTSTPTNTPTPTPTFTATPTNTPTPTNTNTIVPSPTSTIIPTIVYTSTPEEPTNLDPTDEPLHFRLWVPNIFRKATQ